MPKTNECLKLLWMISHSSKVGHLGVLYIASHQMLVRRWWQLTKAVSPGASMYPVRWCEHLLQADVSINLTEMLEAKLCRASPRESRITSRIRSLTRDPQADRVLVSSHSLCADTISHNVGKSGHYTCRTLAGEVLALSRRKIHCSTHCEEARGIQVVVLGGHFKQLSSRISLIQVESGSSASHLLISNPL